MRRFVPFFAVLSLGLSACDPEGHFDPSAPLNISVVPRSATVNYGVTVNLEALITGGWPPYWVEWMSTDTARATVTPHGVVTMKAPGQVKVIASARDDARNEASDTAEFTIFSDPPPAIIVSMAPDRAVVVPNAQAHFAVTVTGTSNRAFTCATSNPTVATVEMDAVGCRATGVATGEATITARSVADPNVRATATVSVVP